MGKIVIAASSLGVHIEGAEKGAKKFKAIYKDALVLESEKIEKSLDKNDLAKNLEGVNNFNLKLYNTLKKIKDLQIVIGGDHSIAIASILATQKKYKKIGVIWVDAHTDFNTFETTITGNIHGLPLAAVVNFHNEKLVEFFKGDFVKPENVVIIGARSIDPKEFDNLRKAKIKVFKNFHKYLLKIPLDII